MTYRGVEEPNYYVITKSKVRGHHIVTPYASRPQNRRGYVVVSGRKKQYRLNRDGYALTKTLPQKETILKPRTNKPVRQNLWSAFGRGY